MLFQKLTISHVNDKVIRNLEAYTVDYEFNT